MSDRSRAQLWGGACGGLAIFAAVFVWVVGHRGTFLLDQSILFDGAWRVYQGQVPYRDFLSTFPPIPFFIQALVFRLVGVDFSATVLAATVVNGAATLVAIWIVRRLVPREPVAALAAGLCTAVWFQAPAGTLWFEQTAFAFNLGALAVLLKATDFSKSPAGPALRGLAGVLLTAAMLSKQNAGIEFVPVAIGIAVLQQLPRPRAGALAAAQIVCGLLLGFTVWAMWLWTYSSPAGFWHSYVELARQIGGDRIDTGKTIVGMLTLSRSWEYALPALASLGAALFLLRRPSRARVESRPPLPLALIAWVVVSCVLYQNLFQLHTDNDIENALPFLGIIYGLAIGALWTATRLADPADSDIRRWRPACLAVAGVTLAVLFAAGAWHSWIRTVQQFDADTRFASSPLNVPRMTRVQWGEPTRYGSRTTLGQHDFEALNGWLTDAAANFFVFPDSTMLYGLHQRVSPQPWLYFSPGHGFLEQELPDVDRRVVASLKSHDVRIIVLETDSWTKQQDLWKRMPELAAWITHDFEKVAEFGIYRCLVAREPREP